MARRGVVDQQPVVDIAVDSIVFGGGLDIKSAPFAARPGSCRYAVNYEQEVAGGYSVSANYERFDGRPRPSDAQYQVLAPETVWGAAAVAGATVTGATSAATGVIVYVSDSGWIAITKVVGVFVDGETIEISALPVGVLDADADTPVTGFIDNEILAAAGDLYRTDIVKPAGSGQIRGGWIIDNSLYCVRDNAGATAAVIFKATASGWTAVTLHHEVGFDTGTAAYDEGDTITQGLNSATVKRIVLEGGDWLAGDARGRLIVTAPAPGNFSAGAATGGGTVVLLGANAIITLLPGGRYETDTSNFYGSTATRRVYGCDGVNREFEFGADVYVPLETGMPAGVRGGFIKVHKKYLWIGFRSSVQRSEVGSPYEWDPVFGAEEMAMGDDVTGFCTVGGSEDKAALMVFCKDSAAVVYGSSPSDFSLKPLSDEAGANPYSVQDVGSPMVHDVPGFRNFKPTQDYGNFVWELASILVEAIARERIPGASVFVKSMGRYRCFFTDGVTISATPYGKGGYAWMPQSLAHTVVCAWSAEVAGVTRTFYGTGDGWVMEADRGRGQDGGDLNHALVLNHVHQKSPTVIKQYRGLEIEARGSTAFTLSMGCDYKAADPETVSSNIAELLELQDLGNALIYSGSNWGEAQWGAGVNSRKRVGVRGQGVAAAVVVGGDSDTELPHTIYSAFIPYTRRRLAR